MTGAGGLDPRVASFLARRRVAHLATADERGRPHVVPVCFAVLDQTVYSAIDQKPKRGEPLGLRRVRNVLANPRAALLADVYDDEDWSRLAFALLHGRARLVEPPSEEHAAALRALRARYPQYQTMALEERPLVALDVERVTTWGAIEDGPRAEG